MGKIESRSDTFLGLGKSPGPISNPDVSSVKLNRGSAHRCDDSHYHTGIPAEKGRGPFSGSPSLKVEDDSHSQ